MPTPPARCTRTRVCIRSTRCRAWSSASTTPCCAPIRFTTWRASRDIDWLAPIIADAEAGFGGNFNAFELTKALIRAGAAAVHFEDQLSSAKKCGHLGGKVLVSTSEAINKLVAARLAADVLGVPTVIIARTDADAANLLLTDNDPRDAAISHRRTLERGILPRPLRDRSGDRPRPGLCALCGSDLVRNLQARLWGGAPSSPPRSTRSYPHKLLAYNCSPSFNWQGKLDAGRA